MFDLIVAGAVAFAAWYGSKAGPVRMTMLTLELTVAVIAGLLLMETVAGLLMMAFEQIAPFISTDMPYQMIAVAAAFAGIAGGGFVLVRMKFHADEPPVFSDEPKKEDEEEIEIIDRAFGAVSGLAAGVVGTGAIIVLLSMLPVPSLLRANPRAMTFDVGGLVLQLAGTFEPDWHEGKSLVVYGEPMSSLGDPAALLSNEPWFDVDEDGECGEADRWSDVDESESYTKDLYFADLDGDGERRIGLYDKLCVGRWDGFLVSSSRPRPERKRSERKKPPAPKPAQEAAEVKTPPPESVSQPPATPPSAEKKPEPAKPKPDDDFDF